VRRSLQVASLALSTPTKRASHYVLVMRSLLVFFERYEAR